MLQSCSKAIDMASDHLDRAAQEMARAVAALRSVSEAVSGDRRDQARMIGEMAHVQVEMAAGLAMLVRHLPAGKVDLLLSELALPMTLTQEHQH
ncbi:MULTISPECIES: hypothetical protein [unclassified Beijerinckia]|uniref:hypothetical protein n=1 Tax=unclassified Beijerinckia TaxID=2638183 RepID=UPI00089B5AA4|nr:MULTISPECIES: hypothetical protein [unclassified Beijerinckia]MDH7799927.1 hypothetical protein [Beijerinckia sp. GAS462]SED42801.1 hypothetical protein SAMN05443249_5345 [Beijerinckia sp. 28-YEA-48]